MRPLLPLSIIVFLTLPSLTHAHGKVTLLTGSLGGNTTALGIRGGIVPGTGPNSATEIDTTVFRRTNIKSNGLGRTTAGGRNKAEALGDAMALSGEGGLPKVGKEGGWVEGVWHVVTTDGAGPIRAVVDPTATGAFKKGIEVDVTTNIPGNEGNIRPGGVVPRFLRALQLSKRAANVNMDFAFNVSVPAGMNCSGSVAGLENVCFMKIANANEAGPFGGVVAFRVGDGCSMEQQNSTVAAAVLPPVGNRFKA